jgi:molybdopterin converting factor small subunit
MNAALKKQIGVWLDHSEAHFIGHSDSGAYTIETVQSPYERNKREAGENSDHTRFGANANYTSNNENRKHNIAQNELNRFFDELESKLEPYDEILLFGPTTAKEQLYNRLSENKQFAGKTISVKPSDKLSQVHKEMFVADYFKV